MATGRTTKRWTRFVVDDGVDATMREIPVNSINGVGLEYPEADVTAFQDAIRGVLLDTPDCTLNIGGPFDNSALAAVAASGAAPTLSGSHTVLKDLVGKMTPLALGVYVGIRAYWATGDPTFGITGTAANGFICTAYSVNLDDSSYTATFKMYPGSAAPEWGTAAVT